MRKWGVPYHTIRVHSLERKIRATFRMDSSPRQQQAGATVLRYQLSVLSSWLAKVKLLLLFFPQAKTTIGQGRDEDSLLGELTG